MNKEETLALWQQGKDAWNAWAQKMLARRAGMEQAGTWAGSQDPFGDERWGNKATVAWMQQAAVDFEGHAFDEEGDFVGFSFPGPANFATAAFRRDGRFEGATFSRHARFEGATFSGGAGFGSATFSEDAWFHDTTFSGTACFGSATFNQDAEFNRATFSGEAGFVSATFSRYARFNRATFSGYAWFVSAKFGGKAEFEGATFGGNAWFDRATFSGDALFDRATFGGDARFEGTRFSGYACFGNATFGGYAVFDKATFTGDAQFAQAKFGGYTTFANATFERLGDFSAAQGDRAFTLGGVFFAEVPDFIQAHFSEAPRLDNSHVRPGFIAPRNFWDRLFPRVKPDANRSARYRALKRLAIDGHDHVREQEYFAGELKSLRGCPDRLLPNPLNWFRRDESGRRRAVWPGGARYWFGLGYQLLSDFGRSMLRPLGWWGVAVAGFAWGYLAFARGGDQCAVGEGTPWSAALGLSIRKALPFAGIASSEKLNQIYACLYGIHGQAGHLAELPDRFTLVIPDAVDYIGMVQLVLSILLLFLFLLAVRSHFRIR